MPTSSDFLPSKKIGKKKRKKNLHVKGKKKKKKAPPAHSQLRGKRTDKDMPAPGWQGSRKKGFEVPFHFWDSQERGEGGKGEGRGTRYRLSEKKKAKKKNLYPSAPKQNEDETDLSRSMKKGKGGVVLFCCRTKREGDQGGQFQKKNRAGSKVIRRLQQKKGGGKGGKKRGVSASFKTLKKERRGEGVFEDRPWEGKKRKRKGKVGGKKRLAGRSTIRW